MKKIIALLLALFMMSSSIVALANQEQPVESQNAGTDIKSTSKVFNYAEYSSLIPQGMESSGSDIVCEVGEAELSAQNTLNVSFDCLQNGLYGLEIEYAPIDDSKASFDLDILIDGKIPFSEAQQVSLPCFYTTDSITVNEEGDDVRPNSEIDKSFHTFRFYDKDNGSAVPYEFYIEKGNHTVSLKLADGRVKISKVKLFVNKKLISYKEYVSEYSKEFKGEALPLLEAENILYTNSNYVIASSDPGDVETTPSDPINKKINVVGGSNWKSIGDLIAWEIMAPEEGLYNITFRYKQNFQMGLNSYRTLYVNGEIPFEEAKSLAFPYSNDWQKSDFGFKVHLNKGENVIALEVAMGETYTLLQDLNAIVYELNTLYRNIIMITGVSPDGYRDYNLQNEIPGIKEELAELSKKIKKAYDNATKFVDGSGQLYVLQDTERQLADMSDDLRSITKSSRLSRFKSNISSISTLLANFRNHPLLLDSISVYGDSETAFSEVGFFSGLGYRFKRFVSTFAEDYASADNKNEINVWIPTGRDQLQVLNDLTENDFTPQTGIKVNLQLVTGSLIHAVLAGKGPDVALSHGETDVINYAMRGAVVDLSEFDGFSDVISKFSSNATLPYQYNGGVYALPETQNFQMMFVRTDILSELGIEIPQTWDDVIKNILPALNRNNLAIGLGNLNNAGALQNIYTTILTQSGGSLYSEDLLSSALNEDKALSSFDFVVSLYRDYGVPQEYDFVNRFRTGEMPIALSGYTAYNQLQVSAPEISGLWEMCEIPGTIDENGNINRSQIMTSTACVILNSSEKKQASWEFLSWFTGVSAQKNFGLQIEAVLGESGRYATANIEAMNGLLWQTKQLSVMESQRSESTALQQVPGSYYVGKALNSATVLSVTKDGIIAREELIKWDELIDAEIARKADEFDFKGNKGGKQNEK